MRDAILRMRHLPERTGLGVSTIFGLVAKGLFPAPQRLTPDGRAVGWRQSVVDEYLTDPAAWVATNSPQNGKVAK
jgi:predicted DNA-binding transcriptional regulator AlpA